MNSGTGARLIVAMLVVSSFAIPTLGNDAGTGGDAGDTTSTAANLTATNGTYYGNLSSSDTDDYYAVNMSADTGIYVEMISPGFNGSNGTNSSSTCSNLTWWQSSCDFDLYLYDSSGSTIDSSFATGTDDVSSNGSTVGGTTVYIRVERYAGDGQYFLMVNIFSTVGGGGGGGGNGSCTHNDAGSCQDAPGNDQWNITTSMANALNITVTNTTYQANLSSTSDIDWFAMSIPQDHGIMIEMIHLGSADFDMWLYDSNGTQIDIAYTGLQPENVASNGTNVGGTIVYLQVDDWGSSAPGWYNLTLELFSTAGLPAYNQDDAGTGADASNDYLNPTNLTINTVSANNSYTGWGSLNNDLNDNYQTTVPMGYGIAVSVWFNYSQADFQVILGDDQANTIDYSGTNNPEHVTSNGSGTYPGMIVEGMDVLVQVRATSGEGYYGMSWWFFSLDSDGDGHWDTNETDCGSDPDDINSVPDDFDGDGTCDVLDEDDDNDGVNDGNDPFPYNSAEWADNDNDGTGDNADEDDDNDGWNDTTENLCGTNPLDRFDTPTDTDGDGECNAIDVDDDGDGWPDDSDDFPLNDQEWLDTDNDGTGNNADTNDDGDAYTDDTELNCGSDPLDWSDRPTDMDSDGICDALDPDIDGDGFDNAADVFPEDSLEWFDTDNDGTGNNADMDDDGDNVGDDYDFFPLNVYEWADNDGDDIGDNSDPDDDNDGWLDVDEVECGSDQMDPVSMPDDADGDHICNIVDTDNDNDGVLDLSDDFPYDETEWLDTDGDGEGNNGDTDDDGDGWPDVDEPNCGTDPLDDNSIPIDFDRDMFCDSTDEDDDNDGVLDWDDAFPFDDTEQYDTDGDGIGNNADFDDDGDGWYDNVEAICGTDALAVNSIPDDVDEDDSCNEMDEDDDGDGILDNSDAFPQDPNEWQDRNNDGLGDNAYPLSIGEKISLHPIMVIGTLLIILGGIGGTIFMTSKKKGDNTPYYQDDNISEYEDIYAEEEIVAEIDFDETAPPPPPPPPGLEPVVSPTPPPLPPPGFEPKSELTKPPSQQDGDAGDAPPPPPGLD
jgi:hypothetical protein